MKNNLSIQIKAAFLLVVFSLNIVVGFACSVGIDMGFNKHHHDNEMMAEHSDHHHSAMQTDKSSHHHDDVGNPNSKEDDGNCCKDKVAKIATADKSLPQSYSTIVNPVFFASFVSTYYQVNISLLYPENISVRHFVRSSPPTIQDIRIAIQSFLI